MAQKFEFVSTWTIRSTDQPDGPSMKVGACTYICKCMHCASVWELLGTSNHQKLLTKHEVGGDFQDEC